MSSSVGRQEVMSRVREEKSEQEARVVSLWVLNKKGKDAILVRKNVGEDGTSVDHDGVVG